jgi:hypothetical protein
MIEKKYKQVYKKLINTIEKNKRGRNKQKKLKIK